jgi:hypothetical protein
MGSLPAADFPRLIGRLARELATRRLSFMLIGGAALDHHDPWIGAGFNLYEIDDAGAIATVQARVLDPSDGTLRPTPIAETTGCA